MKKVLLLVLCALMLLSCMSAFAVSADEEDSATSPLYQKSVLFVGDSLCEGLIEWNDATYKSQVGYAGRIMVKNEMTGINKSKSGASMSDCRGANTVLAQLQAMSGNEYDYVILEGGVNDAWDNCALGTITEGFEGPFDMTTFAGGLEQTFAYAKRVYDGAIFGYTTNFTMPMGNTDGSRGKIDDMADYIALSIEICKKWNIPYLDLYNDEDLNKNVLKTDTKDCLYDYIHMNSNGFNTIAPIIEAWMETLTVDGIPPEESSEEPSAEPSVEPSEEPSVAESSAESKAEEPASGLPVYVYVIIAVAVIAAVAVVILVLKKKK